MVPVMADLRDFDRLGTLGSPDPEADDPNPTFHPTLLTSDFFLGINCHWHTPSRGDDVHAVKRLPSRSRSRVLYIRPRLHARWLAFLP